MEKRRMCPHCRAFITTSDRVCPYCNTTVGPRAVDRRQPGAILGGLIPHARFTTVVILLINFGLYIAVALYSLRAYESAMDVDGRALFQFGAKLREAILLGQWWRLVTAGFLHGGLLHIMMNSWVLFDLGTQVEEVYGTSRMLVIYFVSSVCGFLASTWWSPGLSVGASAALFGLIGAMIAVGVLHRSALGDAIRGMYTRWAVYGLIFGLLPGFRIDNAAHLGGLAAGFGCAYIAGLPSHFPNLKERFWKAAAWTCVLVTVLAFVNMYLWFTQTTAGG